MPFVGLVGAVGESKRPPSGAFHDDQRQGRQKAYGTTGHNGASRSNERHGHPVTDDQRRSNRFVTA
jgi:hypothetical protein